MSSNISIKRICEHCRQVFNAKTTVTRYCSHSCNSKAHKLRIKQLKIQQSHQDTQSFAQNHNEQLARVVHLAEKLTLDVKELSSLLGLSQRTVFRLLQNPGFPRIKVGRRLLFRKDQVFEFFNTKSVEL